MATLGADSVSVAEKNGWFSTFSVKDGGKNVIVNTVDIYTWVCTECSDKPRHGYCRHEAAVYDYVTRELDKFMAEKKTLGE